MTKANNWTTVTESNFLWERDALDYVRSQFPHEESYRAWSNFEFIADDGSINEVDLLVFSPQGFFLIEIKSRPGRVRGDAGTWIWETDGKPTATMDNPLFLANSKAKKLKSLLARQKACKGKSPLPLLEATVFCSAPDLKFELKDNAAFNVCLREPARPGIMGVIRRRECAGLRERPYDVRDTPMGRTIAQALNQAGVRTSQRNRKVSDYVLDHLIDEGPRYQDWQATHSTLKNVRRRVRIYNVRTNASEDERQTTERAARREAELLEALQHPGILRREGFTEHELGPALIFEHDPLAIRLDHFLAQRHDRLTVDIRLDLMRQIADVIRFAHEKRVVHRALCPQSILVTEEDHGRFQIKIFNWQAGYREGATTSSSRAITATSHVDWLVDDARTAYMAPEAISADNLGEHLDVFSLGAIAYHLFPGKAPAASGLELSAKLRETKGLQISSVLNGVSTSLQELIQWSTFPVVAERVGAVSSVGDFLDLLEKVEDEATSPDQDKFVEDINRAKKGDILPGNIPVLKELGKGSCSVVLLVEHQGEEFVLKIANDPVNNARLKDEADVVDKLRHNHIVEQCGTLEIGDRFAFLMRPVYANREDRKIETLRDRLRHEGRLHVDLLQRFGEDLLDVVKYLEEEAGIPHRDIKPDNIAIGQIKGGGKLHLVLFDFSLSRASNDNIRAGTTGYLDPLLSLRKNKSWDLHAERYAAAATLYELAAGPGKLPKWGDGSSLPAHVDAEATIDGDLFDPAIRDGLTKFFRRAFRRDPTERFDNAAAMRDEWVKCLANIDEALSDDDVQGDLRQLLDSATYDTQIAELGLGARATNALDRANIITVEDLLATSIRKLRRLPGVGDKTRREIGAAANLLRERLGKPSRSETVNVNEVPEVQSEPADIGSLSVDLLAGQVTRIGGRDGETSKTALMAFLGLDPRIRDPWPSQADVATLAGVTRGRIGQLVGNFQARWSRDAAITRLRRDVEGLLKASGGVMSILELSEAILVARGSIEDDPRRTKLATALVRVCVEVERSLEEPKYLVRRDHGRVLIAINQDLAAYACRLGDEADKLANEDLLVPPARVMQRLREIPQPADTDAISDSRLLRLAAAASQHAAVSSRQELYPRGLEPARALKLSQGALHGVASLNVEQIRDRVAGRYPEAAPLPDRPALDELLQQAGFEFLEWDSSKSAYLSRYRESTPVTGASDSTSRASTGSISIVPGEITPEIADARQFQERLSRGVKDGSFLVLMVEKRNYHLAAKLLCKEFPLQMFDFEGLFVDALRDVATKAGAKWEAVVNADATPGSDRWKKFLVLVNRAMPVVEQQLASATRTVLMTYPGLLARYDQMPLLERLREKVGRRDGIPGFWMLVPGNGQPLIDGKAIPVISPGQRTQIPETWLKNAHRAIRTREE